MFARLSAHSRSSRLILRYPRARTIFSFSSETQHTTAEADVAIAAMSVRNVRHVGGLGAYMISLCMMRICLRPSRPDTKDLAHLQMCLRQLFDLIYQVCSPLGLYEHS